MKKYILEGSDIAVDKVVRENKIRIARGEVTFTPCEEEPSADFVDDDVNGFPEEPADTSDDFNDEEFDSTPEVGKVLMEPLKSEGCATEENVVTDDKNVHADDTKSVAKPKGKRKKSE